MKERTTRSLLRSVALVGAVAAGATAFGDIHYEWSPAADGTTYWDDAANWETAEYDGADYRLGNNGNEVKFRTAEEVSLDVLFYSGTHTFVADEAAYGLSGAVLNVWAAPWWEGATDLETVLNIGIGTYSFQNVYLNVNTETGGKSATLTLNGGTLTTPSISGNGTLAVGENGGTFAWASTDDDATISVALTGSGTLTKTGEGTLIITGSTEAFTGKIDVQAGSVKLGSDAEATRIAAGTVADFNPVYTWTGEGEDNLWSNLDNWLVSGPTGQTVPTAAPGVDSTVVIPEGNGELTIKVGGSDCSGNLTINRNVKFQRAADNQGIRFTSVSGSDYTLTLEGGGSKYIAITGNGNPVFDCNLKIVYWVRMTGDSVFRLNGSLSGGGKLEAQSNSGEPGFEFAGDTSAFTGSYTGGKRNNGNRDGTRFYGNARGSETGAWSFGGADDYKRCALRVSNTTYYFGSLNTIFGGQNRFNPFIDSKTTLNNATLVIGGRADSASNFGGTLGVGKKNKIVKVGDTSTLNVTLTDVSGEVEAQAGYVNLYGQNAPETFTFSGKTAQLYVEKTVGTYGTEEVDSGEADDPETEDVDESKTTQETFTAWAPTAYGAYQLESEDVTDENEVVTGKKYYYVTVANDADGESYYSVAEAFEGVTAKVAENPEFDTTVYLTRSTTEAVVIPVVGYSLSLGEYTVNSVIGGAGVTTTYNEETKVWETSENAETWIGEDGGLWSEPTNWSGGYTPNDRTFVTFDSDAVVYTDATGWGGEAAAVIVNGNVTLQANATLSTYSNIACYGDITGTGTLTLGRFGIDAGGKAINIDCDVVIENDTDAYATSGRDSWFTNGSFTVNGTTTVNGLLKTYAPTVFVGDVVIEDGGTVTSYGGSAPTFNNVTMTGKSGIYTYAVTYNGALTMGDEAVVSIGSASQTYGEGFVLSGSGTIVADTQLPGGTLQTNLRGNGGEGNVWTGTCEIKSYGFRELNPSNFGNANSTVSFNGATAQYFRNGTYAMGIKLVGNGLSFSGDYSRTVTFSGKLSGDGTLTTTAVGGNGLVIYFTGDVSEFAGSFALNAANPTAIVFGNTATGSGERIVVNEGSTATLASGATWSSANVIVNGELTVAGTLDVPDGCIWGNGNTTNKIKFTNATTALTIEKFASSWNGTYVVGWNPDSSTTHFVVDNYGRAGSKVEIAGVDGAFIALPSTGSTAPSIATEVILTANWTINNGWAGVDYVTTFSKLSGSGTLTVNGAGSGGDAILYEITTLNNFTGTLAGNRGQFILGDIVTENDTEGACLVKLTKGLYAPVLVNTTVNGAAASLEYRAASEGASAGIYRVAVKPGYDGGDDSTFTIDSAVETALTAMLPEGVSSLGETVEGKNFTYAQGYALGLVAPGEGALEVEDLTATIEVVDGKVVVSIGSEPDSQYTVTCNVYEKASLDTEWPTEPTQTYVVGSAEEAAGFTPASAAAGFYKVGVKISNK